MWWRAADELGLIPDPILIGAQARAVTLNSAISASGSTDFVDATDLLPDCYFGEAAQQLDDSERMLAAEQNVRSHFAYLRAVSGIK